MNGSMLKGVLIGGVAAVAVGAGGMTGYQALVAPKYAEVIAVKEIMETVKTPREECQDVQVQEKAPVKDEHRIAGKVIGAAAGVALGSMVGGGSGRTVAMVAGGAAGGYAGNKVQKNMQDKDVVTKTERQCKTVYDTAQKHAGYDVSYRLDGKEDHLRLAYDPGKRIPVQDGKLVLEPPPAKSAPAK